MITIITMITTYLSTLVASHPRTSRRSYPFKFTANRMRKRAGRPIYSEAAGTIDAIVAGCYLSP